MKPKRAYTLYSVGEPLSKIIKFLATNSLFVIKEEHLVIKDLFMCFKGSVEVKFEFRSKIFGFYPKISNLNSNLASTNAKMSIHSTLIIKSSL